VNCNVELRNVGLGPAFNVAVRAEAIDGQGNVIGNRDGKQPVLGAQELSALSIQAVMQPDRLSGHIGSWRLSGTCQDRLGNQHELVSR
jgi:hypothetical protein